jgi:2,3-bisphosphoglycerate-independent phosphoglycerate mutase
MKPILLCILDGWGVRQGSSCDAIFHAKTPNFDDMILNWPNSELQTSGLAVGLPEGQMGNSEVGHMNIGGGRVVLQTLPKIDTSIANREIKNNEAVKKQISALKTSGGALHILGLASDGGVHAHINHLIEMSRIYSDEGIKVLIHAFTDGRDTAPDSALGFIKTLEDKIANFKNVSIATVSGRYYAMDRDNRWDRVEKAYNAIISAEGEHFKNASEVIKKSYENKVNDEFIIPTVIEGYKGFQDNDGLLMVNFRADRARQILDAILNPDFKFFSRSKIVKSTSSVGMADYSEDLSKLLDTIFPADFMKNTLGEIVSKLGGKQLRIAETEKYAHVTFFFNGGVEEVFAGEDRILVPSPKVATYDLQPEMSAVKVTDNLVEAIESKKYQLMVANYANTDMVGHSGLMNAAMSAVETVDACLGRLRDAIIKTGGILIISADHGNAEMMCDPDTHQPHTSHTIGPVPFLVVNGDKNLGLKNGRLADIAPTILEIMGVAKPAEMNGESLIAK